MCKKFLVEKNRNCPYCTYQVIISSTSDSWLYRHHPHTSGAPLLLGIISGIFIVLCLDRSSTQVFIILDGQLSSSKKSPFFVKKTLP
jgi:hypothetical protein